MLYERDHDELQTLVYQKYRLEQYGLMLMVFNQQHAIGIAVNKSI